MKQFLGVSLVAVCFPVLVYSQLVCHRCYGSGYCNNGSHPDFITDGRIATCNVDVNFTSNLHINNPVLNNVQTALNEMILKDINDKASPASITNGHCLTATVHEPHATHTLRTCVTRTTAVNNSQTLCELINGIIDPLNWYQGNFTCKACNNAHLCNTHTLTSDDGLPDLEEDEEHKEDEEDEEHKEDEEDEEHKEDEEDEEHKEDEDDGKDTASSQMVSSVILTGSLILSAYRLNL